MQRRLGKFTIHRDLIDSHPEVIKDLMERMIVVRAEHLYHMDAIEYVAISDLFAEVEQGMVIPEYTLTCNVAGDVVAVPAS